MGRFPQKLTKNFPWKTSIWIAAASVPLLVMPGLQIMADQVYILRNPPAPEVERLAQATAMTPRAKRIFYRQQPTIESRDVFLEQCGPSGLEGGVILGCYIKKMIGDRLLKGKIVIKDIDQPELAGTMEVTAAHEMLHAVYAQLSEDEKDKLFEQLKVARKQVTDKRLLKILADYEAEGEERYRNELYAHLGTELKEFDDPELAAHFQRYFRDRQPIIALVEKSAQVVTQFDEAAAVLEAEIERLEAKLEQSRQALEANADRLSQLSRALDLEKTELLSTRTAAEAALQAGDFRADQLIDQFKRGQLAFNQEVEDYNHEIKLHKENVERFDQRVAEYHQEVDIYNQLAQDTRKVLEGLQGVAPVTQDVVLP